MSKNVRGNFKLLVGAVVGVSLLGACGAPGESADVGVVDAQASGEISATVTAAKASLAAREDVSVTVTLTNTSSRTVSLLKWYVPGGELKEGMLSVSRDGQKVAYIGAHFKRVAPTEADYVKLAPGQSVSGTVRVSDAYDLSQSGNYTIGYDLGAEASHAGDVSAFKSNELSLFIEGRLSELQKPQEGVVHAESLSYYSCTSTRQTTISSAVSNAGTYATNAYNYLNTTVPGNTARYKTWFGSYTSTGWSTAKSHFNNIKNAFATAAIVVDCTCTDTGTYAYVYPTQPYRIYVCGAFWSAPLTGTDSKAGTLVHEMSHFNVVASTDDWAYGQSAAKSLAISNPSQALDNADSHEYFAENNPFQN